MTSIKHIRDKVHAVLRSHTDKQMPSSIWALGLVSLCMDTASEMIHALLPVFLVSALGASALTVGGIEGIGEATAAITKLFSGWISDRVGQRKGLAVAGYGLGALSKPLFALAPTAGWILAARFTDRVGKGIRGAPRDALIGDIVPAYIRGAAYGLRQSLDTVGAFAGPLLAIGLMAASSDNFRLVFWLALIPGLLSVAILITVVREPRKIEPSTPAPPLRLNELRGLGALFWGVVSVGTLLTLARFSEAFLILRARDEGLPLMLAPLVLVVMNVVYALTAYPAGALSDRMSKQAILLGGFAVLIMSDLILALSFHLWSVMTGIALWGLHMGLTQGLLASLVADAAPDEKRGSAFGVFHLITGIALLAASLLAGGFWAWIGPSATFAAGAGFTVLGLIGGLLVKRRLNSGNGA